MGRRVEVWGEVGREGCGQTPSPLYPPRQAGCHSALEGAAAKWSVWKILTSYRPPPRNIHAHTCSSRCWMSASIEVNWLNTSALPHESRSIMRFSSSRRAWGEGGVIIRVIRRVSYEVRALGGHYSIHQACKGQQQQAPSKLPRSTTSLPAEPPPHTTTHTSILVLLWKLARLTRLRMLCFFGARTPPPPWLLPGAEAGEAAPPPARAGGPPAPAPAPAPVRSTVSGLLQVGHWACLTAPSMYSTRQARQKGCLCGEGKGKAKLGCLHTV